VQAQTATPDVIAGSEIRGGGVAIVQRFGSVLNLKVHVHALVLDGVFVRGADGRLQFHLSSVHAGRRQGDQAD
jgi:hypothetical protein